MIDTAAILRATREFSMARHADTAPCHDFSHVERVLATAERLALEEGADPFVVSLAALLHDIGRGLEPRLGPLPDRHEELSVEIAGPFLEARGLPRSVIDAVLDAILNHRHRRGRTPSSIEAKCLYDADKLDSLGAVGVARAYLWLGEHGRSVHYTAESWAGVDPANNATENDSIQREWQIKLSGLKDALYTESGRALAAGRHERMRLFLADMELEVRGEA
ncbi:MAG: HD domain-containing protein [Spirochaetes bacterium]|nr:HD domain-containing protein [Spirochaetota bacterium]MBU1079214.1 HD domain-containing protein [Spirochaetota bacterium]